MGLLLRFSERNKEKINEYLDLVVDYIIDGKLIAFPTNSVYGLGGDPLNIELMERLFNIKFRDRNKGFLLLLSDYEEASKIAIFNDVAQKLAKNFWPGQLTLILERKKPNIIPMEVTAFKETIGLRVPENKVILEILRKLKSRGKYGGIIGTSANFSGEKPSISGAEVAKSFLGNIDLVLDSGKSISKIPTTIVDCTTNKIKFLRIGIISKEDIINVVGSDYIE
ncbi:MAG: L-threonylcarbamoyladenylate synthase [Promethearchaeota archaeon]